MSNKEIYVVRDTACDYEVVIEVDHEKLTPELALEINAFWDGAEERLQEENGNAVTTIIRLAGAYLMRAMMQSGGAIFDEIDKPHGISFFTEWLGEQEGWPAAEKSGIRCISACVDITDFYTVEIIEAIE